MDLRKYSSEKSDNSIEVINNNLDNTTHYSSYNGYF